MVLAGDLVPAGTTLVTPALHAIQQCLFCTKAMAFVKTMQSPVTAKNKTDSGSGSVFSEMLDSRLQKQM